MIDRNHLKIIKVKTYYLEINKKNWVVSKFSDFSEEIKIWEKPDPSAYLSLYNEIGATWNWYNRRMINEKELEQILNNPKTIVYQYYSNDQLIGFGETFRHDTTNTELVYFGLKMDFLGKGHGKAFFHQLINETFTTNTKRIWLHTCELPVLCASTTL